LFTTPVFSEIASVFDSLYELYSRLRLVQDVSASKPSNTALVGIALGQAPAWACIAGGLLVLVSYLLAHWQFLASESPRLDWQAVAQQARQQLFPQEVIACFLKELAQLRPLLAELGWSIEISPIPVSV
jgi:hypothetical protein